MLYRTCTRDDYEEREEGQNLASYIVSSLLVLLMTFSLLSIQPAFSVEVHFPSTLLNLSLSSTTAFFFFFVTFHLMLPPRGAVVATSSSQHACVTVWECVCVCVAFGEGEKLCGWS